MMEGSDDVGAAFVADSEAAIASEPSERAFDYPAIPSQTLGAVDATPSDARLDGAPAQCPSALREIVPLVGMEFGRSPAGPSPTLAHRRHGIDQDFEEAAVVDVCRGEPDGKRDAPGIGNEVSLASGSAAIGRIGAGRLAPLLAGTDALSTHARLQSMAPARPRRSSRTRWSLSHTSGLPVAQPSPARHARAATHLLRQHFPRQTALQNKQNAGQCGPVRDWRPAAFRPRPPLVAAARSGSTIHPAGEAWPCRPRQPARAVVPGSVRRS
jgi:hypothetical protein